jgi:hypothetical protein
MIQESAIEERTPNENLRQTYPLFASSFPPLALMMSLIRSLQVFRTPRYDVHSLENAVQHKKAGHSVGKDLSDTSAFEAGLEHFKEFDGSEVFENGQEGRGRPHLLKVWYFPRENTWEVELRPRNVIFGMKLPAFLASINGLQRPSGRVRFQFVQRASEATLHFLSDTKIEERYQGRGLNPAVQGYVLEVLPEPTVIWHSLDEIRSLEDLYTALPKEYKVLEQATGKDLTKLWKSHGVDEAETLVGLRRIVWKAFYKHALKSPGTPLVAQDVIENLRIVKGLRRPGIQRIDIKVHHAGVLLVQAIKGKEALAQGASWQFAERWLEDYWANIQREHDTNAQFTDFDEELRMREWETQFAWRYKDRLGRPPTVGFLREIRVLVVKESLDRVVADLFLEELPISEFTYLSDREVLYAFRKFFTRFDYFHALEEGYIDPDLRGTPVLEEILKKQSYNEKPFALSREQAFWASMLIRHHPVTLNDVLSFLSDFRAALWAIEVKRATKAYVFEQHYSSRGKEGQIELHKELEWNEHLKKTEIKKAWETAVRSFVDKHPGEAIHPWPMRARLIGLLTEEPRSRVHKAMHNFLGRLQLATAETPERALAIALVDYRVAVSEVLAGVPYTQLLQPSPMDFRESDPGHRDRKTTRSQIIYRGSKASLERSLVEMKDRGFILDMLSTVLFMFPKDRHMADLPGAMTLIGLHILAFQDGANALVPWILTIDLTGFGLLLLAAAVNGVKRMSWNSSPLNPSRRIASAA